MNKQRLEAFSDGVIAIILTVMVLELREPHGASWGDLRPLVPVFMSYVLSFVYLAIYWNNHHHLFQACRLVNGKVLWANLHLLFWLSLTPFVTAWMGGTHFASVPVALYAAVQLCAGVAYFILVRALIALHGRESTISTAVGDDSKGIVSVVLYAAAIPLAFVRPSIACALFAIVAVMWLVPDRRIEIALARRGAREGEA